MHIQVMLNPEISVIIAVYNGAVTIEKAIDSILNQSYSANEIIVIDDGSVDGTREKIEHFGEKVRYVYQDNAGVSAARNKAVNLAVSEWVAFLDADDWYFPDRLALHAEMIVSNPDVGFLTGNFEYVHPDGEVIKRSMENTDAGQLVLQQANGEIKSIMQGQVLGKFVEQHFGDTHTLTLRKSTFKKLGGYPLEFAVCEDVNFLIRLTAISEKIGVVCKPIAAYVIYGNSATRSDPERAQRQTISALQTLRVPLKNSPGYLQAGLVGAIRHARLNLAFVLLKQKNKKMEAIKIVMPLLIELPSLKSVRDVLSIIRG